MSKWISVEDRLPERLKYDDGEPVEYLVMLKNGVVPTTLYFDGELWFDFDWERWQRHGDRTDITHWCELPKPPSEE